jgi:hypothetical protein
MLSSRKIQISTIWIVIFCGLLADFISIFDSLSPAFAALPPLSSQQREADSVYVVTGVVKNISSTVVNTDIGSDNNYTATIEIKALDKGLVKLLNPSITFSDFMEVPSSNIQINVHYRQIAKRPPGWVGPSGQYEKLKLNTQVRLYLRPDDLGRLQLLEPNGWEALS